MRVLLFGTFDILHPGHEDLFRQARQLGDDIHVILARDETVSRVKGRPPLHREEDRKTRLDTYVDMVHLGALGDKYAAIHDLQPDVILLGYDQDVFVDKLQEHLDRWGMHTKIVRALPFHPEKYKSSLLREAATRDIMKGSS